MAASLSRRRNRYVAAGDVHTVPYGERWANRVEGEDDVANIFDSREHAAAAGARMAEATGARHFLHEAPAAGAGGDT
jgi:hypothetical protein